MPQVGKEHFPYTAKGKKAAKKAAKLSGKPMKTRNKGKGTKTADAY